MQEPIIFQTILNLSHDTFFVLDPAEQASLTPATPPPMMMYLYVFSAIARHRSLHTNSCTFSQTISKSGFSFSLTESQKIPQNHTTQKGSRIRIQISSSSSSSSSSADWERERERERAEKTKKNRKKQKCVRMRLCKTRKTRRKKTPPVRHGNQQARCWR